MRKPIEFLSDAVGEQFGLPRALMRLIERHPEARVQLSEPRRTVDVEGVVRWGEWGALSESGRSPRAPGLLLGWRYQATRYQTFELHRPELEPSRSREVLERFDGEIQDVVGVSNS